MATKNGTYVHSSQQRLVLTMKKFRNRLDSKLPQVGQQRGRLTITEYVGHDHRGHSYWRCRCSCGNEVVVCASSLRDGGRGHKTRSCGCLKRERLREARTHGETRDGRRTTEFSAWLSMRFRCRCHLPYVEKGIGVCPEWDSSYLAFLRDVGRAPVDGEKYTMDRIDNAHGYEPGNVRWATHREQNRNKSDNRLLALYGETKCLQDWAEMVGIHPNTVRRRLARGLSVEEALLLPVRHRS